MERAKKDAAAIARSVPEARARADAVGYPLFLYAVYEDERTSGPETIYTVHDLEIALSRVCKNQNLAGFILRPFALGLRTGEW
ncbi:MAG: hypothetical protein HYS74_01285 [Parcubacteria group bacterium]|nr:hypothetical protein [Parcubacteria group bacterium]